MKFAITGGSGYIGLNLASYLLNQGHSVLCIDRQKSPNLDPRTDFCSVDIFDDRALRASLEGIEVVFHLAAKITLAQEDELTWQVNVNGVRRVAEAALRQRVKRMVHVSSCASFDQTQCKGLLSERSPRARRKAIPVYGRSKYAGEMEFLKVVEQGLDGVICYPTGVYGPMDPGPNLSRISSVLLDCARGKVPAMVRGKFDLVDVRDVSQGLSMAAHFGRTGQNYLLAGHYVEMIDVCRMAASLVGRKGPRIVIPISAMKALAPIALAFSGKEAREEGPFSRTSLETIETSPQVDRSKAKSHLGYEPRSTEETIRDLIHYFIQHGMLQSR